MSFDPFKQKLPSAEPIKEHLKDDYFTHIAPLKEKLDDIPDSYIETEVAANLLAQ